MFELLFSLYLNTQIPRSENSEPFLTAHTTPIIQEVAPLPSVEGPMNEYLSAESYLAVDMESNGRIFEKDANKKLPIASLTKLMTALIIVESHSLDEIVTVPKEAPLVEGSKLGLRSEERMTMDNLLKALLIKSGNDVAISLAIYHSGSIDAFVKEMNVRAQTLHMNNTHFTSPHGLDNPNHYSTANDLLTLTKAVWKIPIIRDIAGTKESTVHSLTEPDRTIQNTNKMLGNEVKGIKTGTTDNAGECLILYVEKNNKKIFTIVLGSTQRYKDSESFIDTIFQSVSW